MNLPWKINKELTTELALLRQRVIELEMQVSEQQRICEELEQQNLIQSKVFGVIPDLFAVIDENHRIIFSNWQGGYNYVPEAHRQGNPLCYQVYYGRKTPCEPCHVGEAFSSGGPVSREKINPKIGWVKIHAYPIPDGTGKTCLVLEHIQDISEKKQAQLDLQRYREHLVEIVDERTNELHKAIEDLTRENLERKKVEDALRTSEEKFRAVAETSPAAIILYQGEKFVYVNPFAERLSGFSADELLAMKFWDWIHPDYSDLVKERGMARQQGVWVPPEYEFKYITKAGEERWGLLSAKCIEFSGKSSGIASFVDITERKQAETQILAINDELQQRSEQLLAAQEELVRKEKLAVLGQLSGSLAHELRNPLAAISNAVYFLKSIHQDPDERIKEYLAIIGEEVGNAERFISETLDFSRTRTPKIVPTAVAQLVDSALEKSSVPKDISISTDLPESLPLLRVDPLQIELVLQNLIMNACQAMPHGGTVTINARSVQSPETDLLQENAPDCVPCPNFLEISVADTGEGISYENMRKLFQPLFTTKERGIGLGLTLCRNLTEAHGGHILAKSRPGAGTVFRVTLPAEDSSGK